MNLLERKNDFDVKVWAWINKQRPNWESKLPDNKCIEDYYDTYCAGLIKDYAVDSVTWNKQKNYAQINFYFPEHKINLN